MLYIDIRVHVQHTQRQHEKDPKGTRS